MSTPFLGQITMFSFSFAPKNWAVCNGATLSIQQNSALFAILGTTYGGNGVQTFALPDLQGRIPFHTGTMVLGEQGGEASHTLIVSEIPQHTHTASGTASDATTSDPTNAVWARNNAAPYVSAAPNVSMHPATGGSTGGSQPHENRPPFLVVNFCIAMAGIFPSRN
jgi:microcystin-dependent protein